MYLICGLRWSNVPICSRLKDFLEHRTKSRKVPGKPGQIGHLTWTNASIPLGYVWSMVLKVSAGTSGSYAREQGWWWCPCSAYSFPYHMAAFEVYRAITNVINFIGATVLNDIIFIMIWDSSTTKRITDYLMAKKLQRTVKLKNKLLAIFKKCNSTKFSDLFWLISWLSKICYLQIFFK